jgi:hypothetical protein
MRYLILILGALVLSVCSEPAKSQEITITPPGSEQPRDRDYRRDEDRRAQRERQAREWDRRHCHQAGPVRVCEGTNPYR